MKNIFSLIIFLVALCSCSQNNGHIGPLYGAWTLDGMAVDGQPIEIQGDYTVFSFQGEIVQITHMIGSPDDYTKNFGNFSLDKKKLTFIFQAGESGVEGYQYTAPMWLLFPSDGKPITMDVTELGARYMSWRRVDEGGVYTYKFRKTW